MPAAATAQPASADGSTTATAPAVDQPLFAPVVEAGAASAQAEIPISFGSDAAAPKRSRLWTIAAAALMLLVVGGGVSGYFYASRVVTTDPGVPDAPPAPRIAGALIALPVPAEHEVLSSLEGLAYTILTSGSGSQFPDNRH
jgi:hypothetical protein